MGCVTGNERVVDDVPDQDPDAGILNGIFATAEGQL